MLDLTLVNKDLWSRCDPVDILREWMYDGTLSGTYHFPMMTTINLDFNYRMNNRRNWKVADTERLRTMTKEALNAIGHPVLDSPKSLDKYVANVLGVLRKACE